MLGGAVGYDSTLSLNQPQDSGNGNNYISIGGLKAYNQNNMEHVYDEIKGIRVPKEQGECRPKSGDFSRCMNYSWSNYKLRKVLDFKNGSSSLGTGYRMAVNPPDE